MTYVETLQLGGDVVSRAGTLVLEGVDVEAL